MLIWGIVYQQVENLTFEPRISARAVDLHPAVSFGSALLGAQLFGLAGALLGVPLAATAMAMLEIYKRRYELTAQTEERVAALVAPSAERAWGDKDDDDGPYAGPSPCRAPRPPPQTRRRDPRRPRRPRPRCRRRSRRPATARGPRRHRRQGAGMTSRPRRIGGIVLLVLAALLVPVAVIATWTARTVTDTDAFVARVAPVASSPEVQALIEQEMTDQITQAIDDRGRAAGHRAPSTRWPPPTSSRACCATSPAASGAAVETRTASIVAKVVEAPEFANGLRAGHPHRPRRPGRDPRGRRPNNGAVVTEGDTVSIKLATVGNAVRAELVNAGFSFVDRLPTLEASMPIATVEQLETWQGYYQLLKVLVWLGPLLVIVFAAAGDVAAPRRRGGRALVRRRGAARPRGRGRGVCACSSPARTDRLDRPGRRGRRPGRGGDVQRHAWCATRRSSASCWSSVLAVAGYLVARRVTGGAAPTADRLSARRSGEGGLGGQLRRPSRPRGSSCSRTTMSA